MFVQHLYALAGHDQLQQAADSIKARYLRTGLVKSSTEQDPWPPFHAKIFTNLALLHQKVKQLQSQRDTTMVARVRVAGDIHKIPELTSSLKLDSIHQIFASINPGSPCPMNILIEGHPGIGKTTLAKQICLQWANNKLLTSDKLLLLLMLRDPDVQKISSIDDLVHYTIPEHQTKSVLSYLQTTNGTGVTFIIDGFDELSNKLRQASLFRKLIDGRTLPNSRVVVTSRPSASVYLHQHVQSRIEILGFEKSSKEQYVNNALIRFPSKLQSLKEHFQKYPNIDAICYIPLNLAIIVFLCLLGSLPSTATDMFASFILHTICRHLKRTGNIVEGEQHTELKHLPKAVQEALQQLQRIAFNGLLDDKIVFNINDLPNMCRDDPSCFGLLQSVQCYCADIIGTPTQTFNFLHLGIQEYLATRYVTTLPQDKVYTLLENCFPLTEPNDDELNFRPTDYDSERVRLSNMWIMYCGLTNGQCKALRHYISKNQKSVPTGLSLKISKDFLRLPQNVFYLFHCFQEAQDGASCEMLSKSFDSGVIDVSNRLIPQQVVSLGFFLSKSHRKWKELNLFNCGIGDNGINILHHYLCKDKTSCQKISKINLCKNNLTGESSTLIGDIITNFQPHTVSLGFNNLTKIRYISTAIINTNTVRILQMNQIGLTTQDMPAISDMMVCLEKLHISENKIADVAAVQLSEGLMKTTMLRELYLFTNNIGAPGAKAIANSLQHNVSLEILHMSGDCIGKDGAIAFARMIPTNKTLNELSLYNDRELDEPSVKVILASLHHNNVITKLVISRKIADNDSIKGELAKINAARKQYGVQELKLTNLPCSV